LTLFKKNIGKTLEYTGIGNDFTNRSPIAWGIKERTDE
jgi:hypothetical protein